MFLMPSKSEPCGLSQMIALRYGAVPVVRETGGLRDTVLSYNEQTGAGNGFSFFNYNAHDMLFTIRRALNCYRDDKQVWSTLMHRGMTGDYSWTHSAQVYLSLYANLLSDTVRPAEETKVEPAGVEIPNAALTPPAPEKAPAPKPAAEKPAKKQTEKQAEKPIRKAPAKRAAKPQTEKPKAARTAAKKKTDKNV